MKRNLNNMLYVISGIYSKKMSDQINIIHASLTIRAKSIQHAIDLFNVKVSNEYPDYKQNDKLIICSINLWTIIKSWFYER